MTASNPLVVPDLTDRTPSAVGYDDEDEEDGREPEKRRENRGTGENRWILFPNALKQGVWSKELGRTGGETGVGGGGEPPGHSGDLRGRPDVSACFGLIDVLAQTMSQKIVKWEKTNRESANRALVIVF